MLLGFFFFFLGESEKSGIFCCCLFFFSFFFQVATLIVDPFRPPQPGFSFLKSQSYWCSLSCQKRPFLSSWQQAGDGIKLLVAVLNPPDEGRAGGCHPSRAGQLEEGNIPFPKSRCGTGQPRRQPGPGRITVPLPAPCRYPA